MRQQTIPHPTDASSIGAIAQLLDALATRCWSIAYESSDPNEGGRWSLLACDLADAGRLASMQLGVIEASR